MMNMFTLSLLDLFQWLFRGESIFIKPKQSNILSSLFGTAILIFTALSLALSRFVFDFQIFGISFYTIIIIASYLLVQKLLYAHSEEEGEGIPTIYSDVSDFQTYFYLTSNL